MDDFTQPQQKFAAAGENCDFVITVNFYPVQRIFFIFLCILFGWSAAWKLPCMEVVQTT